MHPPGFHKDEDAKERCYGCSHPEMLEVSPEDEALAKQLVAEGWFSTSNKYRHIARANLPPVDKAMTFSEFVPVWLRKEVERAYDSWTKWGLRVHSSYPDSGIESRELTTAQFKAFKKAGGQSA